MQVTIVAESSQGKKWIADNIISLSPSSVTIDEEHLEDYIKYLQDADITYEER
jgi:hypothetical protein